jgi:hypothetical protein
MTSPSSSLAGSTRSAIFAPATAPLRSSASPSSSPTFCRCRFTRTIPRALCTASPISRATCPTKATSTPSPTSTSPISCRCASLSASCSCTPPTCAASRDTSLPRAARTSSSTPSGCTRRQVEKACPISPSSLPPSSRWASRAPRFFRRSRSVSPASAAFMLGRSCSCANVTTPPISKVLSATRSALVLSSTSPSRASWRRAPPPVL